MSTKPITKFRYELLFLIASHDENGDTGIPERYVRCFKPASKLAVKWLVQNGYAEYQDHKLIATSVGRDIVWIEA